MIPCDVYGSPQPTINWYYNGRSLSEEVSENNSTYALVGDGLLIKNLKRELGGEYTCKAFQLSQIITNVEEQTIMLHVQFKPVVGHHHRNVYAISNGEIKMVCSANALPHPDFFWFRDGLRLIKNIHTENFHSFLSIAINSKDDFGNYSCKVKNLLGEETIAFTLSEGTMPEKPKVLMLRGLSSDTFDIDVGAKRDPYKRIHVMDIRGYRFELIAKHVFQAKKSWKTAIVHEIPFADGATYLINGLEEDTVYMTRVASRNLAGLSEWTDVVEFTTLLKQPKFLTAKSTIIQQLKLREIILIVVTILTLLK